MEIKCDHCGVVVETIMPETVKDGEVEMTGSATMNCAIAAEISNSAGKTGSSGVFDITDIPTGGHTVMEYSVNINGIKVDAV